MESSISKVHSKVRGSFCGQFHLKKQKFSQKNNESWQMESKRMENVTTSYWVATCYWDHVSCYPIQDKGPMYSMFQASDYFSL